MATIQKYQCLVAAEVFQTTYHIPLMDRRHHFPPCMTSQKDMDHNATPSEHHVAVMGCQCPQNNKMMTISKYQCLLHEE